MLPRATPTRGRTPPFSERTPPSFDDVYAAHFGYVFRLAARLAGRGDAEDLTQEVFLVVHRRLAEFRGDAELTTWLFQIVYRVVGAHVRRSRVRRWLAAALGRDHGDAQVWPVGPRNLERAEQAQWLARALGKLSWEKRAAVILHEVEGWTCPQIAERLGVPVQTVYTRLHHARRDLARAMSFRVASEVTDE